MSAPDARPIAPLHVESVGQGPPLVLLHGWALHSGLWGPLVPRLARRFRVHAVDLPGHGHSAVVEPYTLEAVTEAVAASTADIDEPLTVLGWSLGGIVAMHWALAEPQRVARLVLVCTTPRFAAGADWPHGMESATLARFGDELRVAWRQTLQRFLSLQVQGSEHGRAALAAMRHDLFTRGEPAPVVLAKALDALGSIDLRQRVPMLAQPTRIVAGERDVLTPAAASAWLAAALPQATARTIPGAGHAPFLSHPDAFAAALDDFLDGR
jgi:pimeloyl-[acyl-carrier protein] methyl ester esterase